MTSLATIHHKANQLDGIVELGVGARMAEANGNSEQANKIRAQLLARVDRCIDEAVQKCVEEVRG